ncbi:MAG: GIY-YIG nuclease family protein [Chloroflexi bacterium]|nr:GIY-YIG nuclease family protein [Chloroflexota bacterium]
MSFYVYILHFSDDSYYTGHTDNLEARIEAHRQGIFSGYTASRRPVQLVFAEEFVQGRRPSNGSDGSRVGEGSRRKL